MVSSCPLFFVNCPTPPPPLHCTALQTISPFLHFAHDSSLTHPPSPGLAPSIPEDLYHLIKKAVSVRKHLEKNHKDKDSKFRLILIESRIHRLSRYYKKARALPPTWRYDSATASTLIST